MAGIREAAWVGGLAGALAVLTVAMLNAGPIPESPLPPQSDPTFVNWESPHVHPLDITPDGAWLLAVNTADARLEVFAIEADGPVWAFSVPVGLDPVSVRVRTNTEVWVVNHISDSVSIVDLSTRNVVRTLRTQDEPADVVFAGSPQRAFVTCGTSNTVMVFNPANPLEAPASIAIKGESPRAMEVSPDGSKVYVAVFESGNASTVLGGGIASTNTITFPPNVVSDPIGPYGGQNPPPNSGNQFNPPINPAVQPAIKASLIVKKDAQGRWMDDNNRDWTSLVSGPNAARSGRPVGWNMPDRDLAVIDTSNLSIAYATGLMNINMAIGVNPATGAVTIVGTDAINQVRFEPVVNGVFLRVLYASVNPADLADKQIADLNPHLDYSVRRVPPSERAKSLGDPRSIKWNSTGTKGYIAGMGSNNLVVVSPAGQRAGLGDTIPVGEGPTGIALDERRERMYVLNRFEASVSVVDLASEQQVASIPFFDPTPPNVRAGRRHLYNTHSTSGLGYVSCASCHVDAKMDRLAWDLGDPREHMQPLIDLNLGFGFPGISNGNFQPFHPMKGPMTTQTLQAIIEMEPLHWRGDRAGIEAFNGAFLGLQSNDTNLTPQEMAEFKALLASIRFPPNPFRNFDNSLPTNLPLPGHYRNGRFGNAGQPLPNGNAVAGMALYRSPTRRLDANAFACVTCHTLPTGAGPDVTNVNGTFVPIPPGPNGERHLGLVANDGQTNISMKIPHLRNAYKKTGFDMTALESNAGFGYVHDGAIDSLERFVSVPLFTVQSDQEVADLVAFMLAIGGSELPEGQPPLSFEPPGPPSFDTHAAVGYQTTLRSQANPDPGQLTLINNMITQANNGKVGLIAKGRQAGLQRGYAYLGAGLWQSDRAAEQLSTAQLLAAAALGSELTFTVVVRGTQVRLGIDRDLDGCLDRDFRDGTCGCIADFNRDGQLDFFDYLDFIAAFASGSIAADFNDDGQVDFFDYLDFVAAFAQGCD